MAETGDRDLLYRVKDVSDALRGRLDDLRLDAVIERLIAAADHLGAGALGAKLAGQLTTAEGLAHLLELFGQSERALDTAALTLGTVSVHSALDLCASAVLAAVDGRIPPPGGHEAGIPQLVRRAQRAPLPDLFDQWLQDTIRKGRYAELDQLWRDPQTHRPVPKAVFAGPPTDAGLDTRASVRIYRPFESGGRRLEELIGVAVEKLPQFVDFGEERLLALCNVLRMTYAPGWRR